MFGFLEPIAVPFAFVLRYLSEWLDNYGLALIVFALLIALIRLPFELKSKRGTIKQGLMSPKMKEIQEKYKGNQQKINEELQKLYQRENFKPLSGCLWMAFPMLIIFALFGIIREPLRHLMDLDVYQIELLRTTLEGLGVTTLSEGGTWLQVELASYIRPYFAELHAVVPQIFDLNMNLGPLDLGRIPDFRFWQFGGPDFGIETLVLFLLPILSGVSLFFSQKVMTAMNFMPQQQNQQAQMMKNMAVMMPLVSIFIGFTFPAAMSIYWIFSSMFSTLFTMAFTRKYKRMYEEMKVEMDARANAREAELEAKRKETERLRALNATRENKGTSKKKKHTQEREKERQRQAAQRQDGREVDQEENPSRVAHRKFARGRAYDPERFEYPEGEERPNTDLDALDIEETEILESEEMEEMETEQFSVEESLMDASSVLEEASAEADRWADDDDDDAAWDDDDDEDWDNDNWEN